MLLFYPFQNVFNSKIFLVCQPGWLAILFKVPWPLPFEIHFTPVVLNLKLSQVLYFILHQVINSTLRRATREEKGEGLPSPFSKFKKIALILEKKKALTTFIHEFLHEYVVFKCIQEKISEIFPCGAFLSCVADYMFIKVPLF